MENILNQDVVLLNLKVIIYVTNVKNVKKYDWNLHYQVSFIVNLKLTKNNTKLQMQKISKNMVKTNKWVNEWINQKVSKCMSILQWWHS